MAAEPDRRTLDRRSFLRLSAAGALAMGLTAACGISLPGSSVAPGTAVPLEKVRFQLRWIKNVQFAGFFAALEKGFWRDEGLDVEILSGGPNISALQVVTGGGAEVGYGSNDELVRARAEQNVPVSIFGVGYQTPPISFMSRAETPVKTPRDFVGKRVAIANNSRPTFEALLARNNVDINSVTLIPTGVEPSSMATGEVDIYHGFRTNQGSMLEQQGLKLHYMSYADFGYQMYDAPIFAQGNVLESKQDMLVRFLRGSIKGWEYNNAHLDEITDVVVTKYGAEGLDTTQQKIENQAQEPLTRGALTDQKGLFWMAPERWQNTIDFLLEAKSISRPVKVEEITTTALLEKAFNGKNKLLEA